MIRLYLFSILLMFTACNPCKRIQRLAEKNRDCFKAMTEVKQDSGSLKISGREESIDRADSAMDDLQDTVFRYIEIIRDCNTPAAVKEKAERKIKKQFADAGKKVRDEIRDALCLTDTTTFHDAGGAVLKLWQQGKEIKYSLTYPTVKYELEDPGWPALAWFLIGFGTCVLLLIGLVIWARSG